jgi:mono/diheme cytochrome c family protein
VSGECARQREGGAARLPEAREGGAVTLARHGDATVAYVADADSESLLTVDVASATVLATTALGGHPGEALVLSDGRVAVALRDKNRVAIFEPGAAPETPLERRCLVKTPVEPVALAASADDRSLLVTSAWAHRLSVYGAEALEHRFSVDVAREPRDVLVEGGRAFVSHVVGGQVSVIDLDGEAHAVRRVALVPSSSPLKTSATQGFALARSIEPFAEKRPELDNVVPEPAPPRPPQMPAGRIFAPRVIIEPFDPEQPAAMYYGSGGQAASVDVIDAASEESLSPAAAELFPTFEGECMLPRAAAASGRTGGLYVVCAGSDTLLELDPRGFNPTRLERRRWNVAAGPVGLAIDDANARAVVWSQFDRRLSIVSLDDDHLVSEVAAPEMVRDSALTLGRKLFHATDDARVSNNGRACASCHPDGRDDGTTWSTPLGPRQTTMLSGRLATTAPYAWIGDHATLEEHVKETFDRNGGTGFPRSQEGDFKALLAYLAAMPTPTRSDALMDEPAELAARGEALFEGKHGCVRCHAGEQRTDASLHDVGTHTESDSHDAFETPSLMFVGGTAPYFHDGRFATLVDLLTTKSAAIEHPKALPRAEARALAAFLETL